jgi:D-3-phosphoglycerate dehydrogenase
VGLRGEKMAFEVAQLLELPGMPDYEKIFKHAGVEVELIKKIDPIPLTEDQIITAVGDANAAIAGTTVQPFSKRVLATLRNCRFVMSIGIGYDNLDVDAATELGILVANIPDYCLEEVSDHAMALILACTRRVVQLDGIVKRGGWKSQAEPYIQGEIWPKLSRLRGQTLGLVGLGRIARALVPKAKGFGLKIIAYDPCIAIDVFRELEVEKVKLDQLLTRSDIVSVHVPLIPETMHLLGLEQLKKMKPTACLINTARGAVVDHEALYLALSQGYISAAALDVTDPEPLPTDSPLLKLDNSIITAHCGGISPLSFDEMLRRPGEEIIRVVRGEWPVGLLNPQVKARYYKRWGRA